MHPIIKFNSKLTKLVDESKLKASMHSNYQVQFETNQANSMLSKLKASIHSNYQVQVETNQANSMLSKLKASIHSSHQT
jgi:cell fate regulator YaaT (PSP1 superfamily)